MNEKTPDRGNETDALALLIRAAGRREPPPDATYKEVLAATRDVWQTKVRRRKTWRIASAVAASVAVVAVLIGVVNLRTPEPQTATRVAMTDVVVGGALVQHVGEDAWQGLSAAVAVASGSRLRTERDSGLGLILRDDVSLRLDEASEIVFESADRIELLAGAVYIDTGPDAADSSALEIVTEFGTLRDIGTQFEVRRLGDVLRLRVREGLVRLERPTGQLDTRAGDEISLQTDGGFRRAHVSAQDTDWRWIHAVAPAPYVADQSVTDLLEWIGRETGRSILYADTALEAAATRTILHGSRQRLLPMEALAVLLATTDFSYSITTDGNILLDADN